LHAASFNTTRHALYSLLQDHGISKQGAKELIASCSPFALSISHFLNFKLPVE
jgi:hypothetical protein